MSVQEYLEKHLLSRKIEDAVNAAVRAKTSDPVLFISNHMRKAVPSVITKLKARQISDSRGAPSIEVDLFTNKGTFRASVPCGDASRSYESMEQRDGVRKAVNYANEKISEILLGMDPTSQSQIDDAMIDLDKSDSRGELFSNAMLAVSMAVCRAGAAEKETPLYKHISDLSGGTTSTFPVPAFTVLSGGKSASNNLSVKEIMVVPVGATRFEESLEMALVANHHLKAIGSKRGSISSVKEGLDIVKEAITKSGYTEKMKIAINASATDFCFGAKYDLDFNSSKSGQNFKSAGEMIEFYKELCSEYPILWIEDPFGKEDWEHTKQLGGHALCKIVGDASLLEKSKRVHEFSENSLILKVEGMVTVTGAIEAVKLAKQANRLVLLSQNNGETDDAFIADLAVGLAATLTKSGDPSRFAVYNQLLRVEEDLGNDAVLVESFKW